MFKSVTFIGKGCAFIFEFINRLGAREFFILEELLALGSVCFWYILKVGSIDS